MKKISLLSIVTLVLLVFTSCSNEENTVIEEQNISLLKTFEIKKDATGAYSVNFDVTENTKIDKFSDLAENTSEFHLSKTTAITEKSVSQDLLINNNTLKVGFVDVNANNNKFVSIIDDNITFQSKADNSEKLTSYSVKSNEDGTYDLEFSVNDNVEVAFVYNDAISTYEVHLEDGKSGEIEFTKSLVREEGEPLKIDFVNHITDVMAKSSGAESSQIRKPKVIIDGGDF